MYVYDKTGKKVYVEGYTQENPEEMNPKDPNMVISEGYDSKTPTVNVYVQQNPLYTLLGAIVLAGIGFLIWKNWDDIKEKFSSTLEGFEKKKSDLSVSEGASSESVELPKSAFRFY